MIDTRRAQEGDGTKVHPAISNTWDIAQSAFELTVQHRTSADPHSYAVWYRYASETDLDMNAAIDEMLAENGGLSAAEMKQLHADYVEEGDDIEENLENISRAIQNEVAGAKSLVTDIISNTDDYVSSIDKAKDMLPSASSPDEIRVAIDGIIEQTQSSRESAQTIQVALQSKHDEITQLSSKVIKLRESLMRDSLTELINRQKFDALLSEKSSEAIANGYSLTVLFARVENVQDLNEKAGFDVSEFILKSFSGVAKKAVGDKGVCARFSGPEFAILLPQSAYMDAGKIANAMIKELEKFRIVRKPSGRVVGYVQCSIGGSSLRAGIGPDDLIALATAQARLVKASGKSAVKFDLSHQSAA